MKRCKRKNHGGTSIHAMYHNMLTTRKYFGTEVKLHVPGRPFLKIASFIYLTRARNKGKGGIQLATLFMKNSHNSKQNLNYMYKYMLRNSSWKLPYENI